MATTMPDLTGIDTLPRSKRIGETARRIIAANPGITDEALASTLFAIRSPSKRVEDYREMAMADVKLLRTDGEI